ncbi:hypothetical protein [Streptomyces bluensis]|uniref:hypothetical protein n=1 Tax=Streptomyces bluensis TaxID=33897 RepID=UPI00331EDF14
MALAVALTALTGCVAHTEEFTDRIRVRVALPSCLSEARRRSLLMALADADRYGHDVTSRGATIWGEVDTGADADSNGTSRDGS